MAFYLCLFVSLVRATVRIRLGFVPGRRARPRPRSGLKICTALLSQSASSARIGGLSYFWEDVESSRYQTHRDQTAPPLHCASSECGTLRPRGASTAPPLRCVLPERGTARPQGASKAPPLRRVSPDCNTARPQGASRLKTSPCLSERGRRSPETPGRKVDRHTSKAS